MIKYKMDLRNPVKSWNYVGESTPRVSESTPEVSESTPRVSESTPSGFTVLCVLWYIAESTPEYRESSPSEQDSTNNQNEKFLSRLHLSGSHLPSLGVISNIVESSPSGHHRSWKSAVYYVELSPLSAESSPKSGSRLLKNWSRLQKSKIKL